MYWNVSVGLKCVRTTRIESFLNHTFALFVSKNVVSVSGVSAVSEFDGRMEVVCL